MKDIIETFEVTSVDVDESITSHEDAAAHATRLALEKAKAAAPRNKNAVIIAADTLVTINGAILGKPEGASHAKEMLKTLSGKTHSVFTAFCIYDDRPLSIKACESRVTFKDLTDSEIEEYISTGEPFDKAGSYGAQGRGKALIERVEGSLTNVIGLPTEELRAELVRLSLAKE